MLRTVDVSKEIKINLSRNKKTNSGINSRKNIFEVIFIFTLLTTTQYLL